MKIYEITFLERVTRRLAVVNFISASAQETTGTPGFAQCNDDD